MKPMKATTTATQIALAAQELEASQVGLATAKARVDRALQKFNSLVRSITSSEGVPAPAPTKPVVKEKKAKPFVGEVTDAKRDLIRTMHAEGLNDQQIADRLRLGLRQVYYVRALVHKLPGRKGRPKEVSDAQLSAGIAAAAVSEPKPAPAPEPAQVAA